MTEPALDCHPPAAHCHDVEGSHDESQGRERPCGLKAMPPAPNQQGLQPPVFFRSPGGTAGDPGLARQPGGIRVTITGTTVTGA